SPTAASEPTVGVLPPATPTEAASPTVVPTLDAEPSPSATVEAAPELTVVDFPEARSVSVAAVADGTVYVALGQRENLFVARSSDGGASFDAPVQANLDAPAFVMAIERPAIVADESGRVSVGWLQAGLVWYALSEDGGRTFGPSRQVTSTPREFPTLLGMGVDEEHNPVLAWLEGHGSLSVARFHDGGNSFPVSRVMEHRVCDCCQPQPVVVGGQVLVAYRNLEEGEGGRDIRDIYVLRSGDDGETFEEVRVSDEAWYFPACPISGPSLVTDGEQVYASWMDGRNDDEGDLSETDIWFAASADGGQTFSRNVRVNPESEPGYYHNLPSLAVADDGRLHIVWETDEDVRHVLYYASSSDGGQMWAAPQVITSSDDGTERGRPQYATLVAGGEGRLHVSWVDNLGAHVASWTGE
ncbi:MAG TPA: hypothetical protein VF707_16820, partial [Ardenticatenaceae bacterium]